MIGGWWLAGVCAAERSAPPFRRQRCGNHQPPITNHPPPTTLRRLLARRCGEGAGRPGFARCFDSFTVSTKQTCPAQPFSTRPPAGGPCFGPYRIAPPTLLPTARGGHETAARTGSARRAGAGHPSTSARTPEVSFPRASSLDHSPPTSGRWIRRPPHRRDEQIMGAVPAMMAGDAGFLGRLVKSSRCQREICQQSADCQQSHGPPAAIVIPGAEAPAARRSITTDTTRSQRTRRERWVSNPGRCERLDCGFAAPKNPPDRVQYCPETSGAVARHRPAGPVVPAVTALCSL